jgi:hypothetical protein
MSLNEQIDPLQPDDEADLPQPPPHDPIEPDPMNPVPVPPPDTEPRPAERPDLDWSEHED